MPQLTRTRLEMCRKLIASRKIVGDRLGYGMCSSPVLDMLLELYVAAHEERPAYSWSLCMFAHVPISTALRKMETMEQEGMVVREKVGRDRRRIQVYLTPVGRAAVEGLLDRLTQIYIADPLTASFPTEHGPLVARSALTS
jgi:hypothetical protein